MKGTLLIMLLCLLPLCAMAQEARDDGENAIEEEYGITTEVEGKGNKVIVIEELVINLNAGDIVSNREAGGEEAMGLVHRLLDLLHGGPGPDMMAPQPGPHPGMPGMGPEGMAGPPMQRMKMDPINHPQPGKRAGELRMRMHPGAKMGMDGRRPESPDIPMPNRPAMMQMMPGPPDNMDQDLKGLIMRVGKLAFTDPQFRDALRDLLHQYEQGQGEPRDAKQHKPHKARQGKMHRVKQSRPARDH